MKNTTKYIWLILLFVITFTCTEENRFEDSSLVQLQNKDLGRNNSAPNPFNLISPDSAATDKDWNSEIEFKWEATTDTDSEDIPSYLLELDLNIDFSTSTKINAKENTSSKITQKLKAHSRYYWRVVANDKFGAKTFSNIRYFQTKNSKPEEFSITNPTSGKSNVEINPLITWTKSNDPDLDPVFYRLEFKDDNRIISTYNRLKDTTLQINVNFEYRKNYSLRVTAYDNFKGSHTTAWLNFTTRRAPPNEIPKPCRTCLSY